MRIKRQYLAGEKGSQVKKWQSLEAGKGKTMPRKTYGIIRPAFFLHFLSSLLPQHDLLMVLTKLSILTYCLILYS